MTFTARSASQVLVRALLFASVTAGGTLGLSLPAQAYKPAYTTIPEQRKGEYYTGSQNSSFGFFFDITQDLPIDGLGFAPQEGWPGGSSSYTVALWSYDNGGLVPGDYTLEASKTFTPGNVYTIQDGYCWQSIVPVILPESYNTDTGNLKGYVIASIGDYTNLPGNVKYEAGVAVIDPNFIFATNGYIDSSASSPFFPIPVGELAELGANGFFNPNLSYVPGPVPIMGAGVAMGMARKIRKRIKTSK